MTKEKNLKNEIQKLSNAVGKDEDQDLIAANMCTKDPKVFSRMKGSNFKQNQMLSEADKACEMIHLMSINNPETKVLLERITKERVIESFGNKK